MTRLARSRVVIRDLIFASPAVVFSDEWLSLWYHVWALKIRWRWKWFWPISSFPEENFLLLQMMPLVHIWVAAPEEQLDRVTSGLRVGRRALLTQANIQLRWRGSLAKIDWTSQRWARQPSSQTSKHSAQAGDLFTKYSSLEASFVILPLTKSVKISFIKKPHKATKAYSAMTVPNFKDKSGVFCKIMALDTPYQHI